MEIYVRLSEKFTSTVPLSVCKIFMYMKVNIILNISNYHTKYKSENGYQIISMLSTTNKISSQTFAVLVILCGHFFSEVVFIQ